MHGPTDFIYLATPYTSYLSGGYQAYLVAEQATARLMLAGYRVYSPIVSNHHLSTVFHVDKPFWADPDALHSYWMAKDRPFMQHAAALVVLRCQGWDTSRGIAEEIAFFENAKKPIYILDPGASRDPVDLIPRSAG